MRFTAINGEPEEAGRHEPRLDAPAEYHLICQQLRAEEIDLCDAIEPLRTLLRKTDNLEGPLELAILSLLLDICSSEEAGGTEYWETAREACLRHPEHILFRRHARDAATNVRDRRILAEWTTQHRSSTPLDCAQYRRVLHSIGLTDGKRRDPWFEASTALLARQAGAVVPFTMPEMEEYAIELQAGAWNELLCRCADMLTKADAEILIRPIRFSTQSVVSATQAEQQPVSASQQQRASKRIKQAQKTKEAKANQHLLHAKLLHELASLVDVDIDSAEPAPNAAVADGDDLGGLPEECDSVMEFLQRVAEQAPMARLESNAVRRFRDTCLYALPTVNIECLFAVAERLLDAPDIVLLERTLARGTPRALRLRALKLQSEQRWTEAEEAFSALHDADGLHRLTLSRAVHTKEDSEAAWASSGALSHDGDVLLRFDYCTAVGRDAYDLFASHPHLFSPDRLCRLHPRHEAEFAVHFRHCSVQMLRTSDEAGANAWFAAVQHCLAARPTPLPEELLPVLVQAGLPLEEALLRRLIRDGCHVYDCWAALYGLPDPAINAAAARRAVVADDWVAMVRLESPSPKVQALLLQLAKDLGILQGCAALRRARDLAKAALRTRRFAPLSEAVAEPYASLCSLICAHAAAGRSASFFDKDSSTKQLRRALKMCTHLPAAWHLLGGCYRDDAMASLNEDFARALRLLLKGALCFKRICAYEEELGCLDALWRLGVRGALPDPFRHVRDDDEGEPCASMPAMVARCAVRCAGDPLGTLCLARIVGRGFRRAYAAASSEELRERVATEWIWYRLEQGKVALPAAIDPVPPVFRGWAGDWSTLLPFLRTPKAPLFAVPDADDPVLQWLFVNVYLGRLLARFIETTDDEDTLLRLLDKLRLSPHSFPQWKQVSGLALARLCNDGDERLKKRTLLIRRMLARPDQSPRNVNAAHCCY